MIYVDLSGADPANMSPASDALKVHPDERGGIYYATMLFNAISPKVTAASRAEILDLIHAGTYPLMGTQLDTDRAMVGTGGTLTAVTGAVATSKVAINTTGSTDVVGSKVATTGGREKQVITVGGTATADGIIKFEDKTAINLGGATPGQLVTSGFGVKVPAGLISMGSELGSLGQTGTNQAAAVAGFTNPTTQALDSVWFTQPYPVQPASTTGKRTISFRFKTGALAGSAIEYEQGFLYVIRDRLRHKPLYVGDYAAAAQMMRLTGTITSGAGTLSFSPGWWAPAGLTEADFASRRIYKGGGLVTGAGTLLATLTGSTWTYAASGLASGDLLYQEVDCDNGIGGTTTIRRLGMTVA